MIPTDDPPAGLPATEAVAPERPEAAAGAGQDDELDEAGRLTDLAGSWDRRVRAARWGARSARG